MTKKSSEFSRPESLQRVKNGDILLTEQMKKELDALKHRKVDLSDIPEWTEADWERAVVGKFYRPVKKQITIRIDADVLEWFKHIAKKYQSLINRVCREYMLVHQRQKAKKHT